MCDLLHSNGLLGQTGFLFFNIWECDQYRHFRQQQFDEDLLLGAFYKTSAHCQESVITLKYNPGFFSLKSTLNQ